MVSNDAFEGDPCLQVFANSKEDDAIFGPYTTECSREHGGCYDVQMTTRTILPIEYSACMEAATSSALFQGGREYANEIGTPDDQVNRCEGTQLDRYKFNIAETPVPPETTWATTQSSTLAFSGYIDVEGNAYILGDGSANDDDGNGVWDKLLLNTSDSEDTAFQAKKIVGLYSSSNKEFLVLSTDNLLYRVRYESTNIYAINWTVSGISFEEVRFMNCSTDYPAFATLVFESDSTVLYILPSLSSSADFAFINPDGLEWSDAFADNDSIIAIDSGGNVYVYGDNEYAQLGLDPSVTDDYIDTLTKLDTSSFFGVPVKVVVSNRFNPVSFIITDTDSVYSAGRYTDGSAPPGLLGRKAYGSSGYSTFSRVKQKFTEISVGYDVVTAIHVDGTLWGWGRSNECSLGIEEFADTSGYTPTYTIVPITLSFNTSWKSTAARYSGINAINACSKFIGRSYIASNVNLGQIRTNNNFALADYYRTEFSTVLLGYGYAMYLDSDGNVYGAGTPPEYAVGSVFVNPVSEITYFPEFGMVRNMWVFDQGSAYVDSNGDFYITGGGVPRIDSPVSPSYGYHDYTHIPFTYEVIEVVCNQYGMMVRLSNNRVYSWGLNMYFCLAYNGDELGDPESPSWVGTPTQINGEYTTISLGHYHGGGISILGGLVMWGADIQSNTFGLFGTGNGPNTCYELKDEVSDSQLQPTFQVEYSIPTGISITDGPSSFSNIECFKQGTFVTVGESDTSYVIDGYRVNGPRWCSGDIWGTGVGLRNMLYEYTECWKYAGCWRPVLYSCWQSPDTGGYLLEFEEFLDDYFSVGGTPETSRIDHQIDPWPITNDSASYQYVQHYPVLFRKCPYVLHSAIVPASGADYTIDTFTSDDMVIINAWYVMDSDDDTLDYFDWDYDFIEITASNIVGATVYYILKYSENPTNTTDSAYYRAFEYV